MFGTMIERATRAAAASGFPGAELVEITTGADGACVAQCRCQDGIVRSWKLSPVPLIERYRAPSPGDAA